MKSFFRDHKFILVMAVIFIFYLISRLTSLLNFPMASWG